MFINIVDNIDNKKMTINIFSFIKILITESITNTITSVKHKLICPTDDNRS